MVIVVEKNKRMFTLSGRLHVSQHEKALLDELMRNFSACMRYSYQRLLEGKKRKELKRSLSSLFHLNTRYIDDAILEATSLMESLKEKERDPKKVIFGGKKNLKSLSSKHLSNSNQAQLKEKWREKRQGNLYSRGDKAKGGNLNLRVLQEQGQYFLRINIDHRKWMTILWTSHHKKLHLFERVLKQGTKYSVRLKKKEGKYYLHLTIEDEIPMPTIHFTRGAIGIDMNAYPSHLAWVEINEEGNFCTSGSLASPSLFDQSKNKRDVISWQAAHQIVEIAKEKNKGIILENLGFERRKRANSKKLRRIFSNFSYRKLKERIITAAKRAGVSVREVHPAYTSKIGALKYAPQLNLSRHTAAAFVIARRGLNFREKIPKHYALKKQVSSSQCEPIPCFSVNQKKEEAKDSQKIQQPLRSIWGVLWIAILTGSFTRKVNLSSPKVNFSTLKRKLFQGHCAVHGCKSHGRDPPLGCGSGIKESRIVSKTIVKSYDYG
jgi:IS605 OrfB family transposase